MKPIHPWLRKIFFTGNLLSLIAGIQLFVLSRQTETYFAWTIQSPLTAATFGGLYFGTMVFGFLSGRETIWAHVRGPALGLFAFLSTTLMATLLHLDKFHLASQNWLTLAVTRMWMLTYFLIPPMLIVALFLQARIQGTGPEKSSRLPAWVGALLWAHGIAGITLALLLFFAPQTIIPVWPWALTPLTSRVFSAWFISFGIVDLQAIWENDWQNVKIATIGYIIFSSLAMVAMARYMNEVNMPSIGTIGYLVYMLIMLVVGIYGQIKIRQT